ncbi:hypothetical protein [Nitratifractor salsuginis]|uniref:Uncharacterized protein n=1 Tax=Nitratifractor salsuginis (strain DSM 16511 / JCM 12458 / E9I37-1) TaxID=749222 RepID=E6X366_NITSE|nr:hypothetical protein [Nitratifractor salsuginis]ADV46210.1 hypothetical protein Nitsa_0951 [Nitratifractor salsuginis DSM 16511]
MRRLFWFAIFGIGLIWEMAAACRPYTVTGLNPYGDNYLAVRSGPGSRYYMQDTLHNGDRVLVCGYAGAWRRIFYGQGCSLNGAGEPSGYCRNGWAYGRYLVPAYSPPAPGYSGGNYGSSAGAGVQEVYYARLSGWDHYNSRGVRLDSVAAILRQDRANFHKYYRRDPEDTGDSYFANKYNRSILERIVRRSYIPPQVRNAILYGTPYVKVTLYTDGHIRVDLL